MKQGDFVTRPLPSMEDVFGQNIHDEFLLTEVLWMMTAIVSLEFNDGLVPAYGVAAG